MDIYRKRPDVHTRWASFENPTAGKGAAGQANRGAKGAAFDSVAAGETKTLLDVQGSGMVCRMWVTLRDRTAHMLRSLRLDVYWDGAETPAVSAPFGDFFGMGLGRRAPFECEFFSDPVGRSFNCFIPMPFRTAARVTLTNESDADLTRLCYDIDLLMDVPHDDDALYFHAHWRRESPNELGRDFTVLPPVHGAGRYLGCNVGLIASPLYENIWWGEGEFKAWLDGDDEHPTLCGTGTEDFVGTAWRMDPFAHRVQGCLLAEPDTGHWAFYRYHVHDPVYFAQDCRVALQTIGGCRRDKAFALRQKQAPLIPVSIDPGGCDKLIGLMDRPQPVDLADPSLPDGWCNFYRQDDWSATAYFYIDRPENGLPALAPVEDRVAGLPEIVAPGRRSEEAT